MKLLRKIILAHTCRDLHKLAKTCKLLEKTCVTMSYYIKQYGWGRGEFYWLFEQMGDDDDNEDDNKSDH